MLLEKRGFFPGGAAAGNRDIHFARQLSPGGLELHTHPANQAAHALYERHGRLTGEAVQFGISPPPESAHDIE
jgi:hypothetical protein